MIQQTRKKDLDVNTVLSELARLSYERPVKEPSHSATLDEMFAVLVDTFRPKLQVMLPPVEAKLEKIAGSRGDEFPEIVAAVGAMNLLRDTLEHHLFRVDGALLPRVHEIAALPRTANQQLEDATHRLKADARLIQGYLNEIRELTSRYRAPEGTGTSFSAAYRELASFDETLSQFLEIEEDALIPRLLTAAGT